MSIRFARGGTAASLLLVGLAAPSVGQAQTIAPVGAECFVQAERDSRDDRDYAKYTPEQVPTLTVTGLVKEKAGQSQNVTVTNTGPGFGLFQGTAGPTLRDGAFTSKYLLFRPESLYTNGAALPTRRTEINTLVVRHELNGVLKFEGSVSFRLGLLAATAPFRDKAKQRRTSTWKVSGLGPGVYYAFFRARGKTVERIKLGTATGPCGYLSTRQYTKPKKGKGPWDIHIQRSASFSAAAQQLVYKGRSAALFSSGEFAGVYAKPLGSVSAAASSVIAAKAPCAAQKKAIERAKGDRKAKARARYKACLKRAKETSLATDIKRQLADQRLIGKRGDGQSVNWLFCSSGTYKLATSDRSGTGVSSGTRWVVTQPKGSSKEWTAIIRETTDLRAAGLSVGLARKADQYYVGIARSGDVESLGAVTRTADAVGCAAL